jgi:hypothetical protein
MPWLLFNLSAVAIAALFYVYRHAQAGLFRQRKKLRERVAFMMWAAAQQGS